MAMGVTIKVRSRIFPDRKRSEIVVLRDDKPVAILTEQDPMRRALDLSPGELESVMKTFPTIMRERPRIRKLLESIIDFKRKLGLNRRW